MFFYSKSVLWASICSGPKIPIGILKRRYQMTRPRPQEKGYCLQFSNKEPRALRGELMGAFLTLPKTPLLTNPHPVLFTPMGLL